MRRNSTKKEISLKVEFYRHQLGEEELDGVKEVLDSLFLTTGPKTQEFERRFASYLGVNGCLGVTSWTMGNFITLKALDIGPGDKGANDPAYLCSNRQHHFAYRSGTRFCRCGSGHGKPRSASDKKSFGRKQGH